MVGLFGSFASKRARWPGDVGLGPVAFEPLLRPEASGGVAFLFWRSRSLSGVYLPELRVGGPSLAGYGSGAVGGLVGGAGNVGMGGGRENAGWFELPAESVRGGGLRPSRPFCILKGATVDASVVSVLRRNSSSGLPCLRPSMAGYLFCTSWSLVPGSRPMSGVGLFLGADAGRRVQSP